MACVAEHHAPALSRTGVRQPPAWSVQDDTVVPFALRQRGAGEAVTGAVPSVAACTEIVTQQQARAASAVGIRIAATHGCLG
jgi:hypothetical protein